MADLDVYSARTKLTGRRDARSVASGDDIAHKQSGSGLDGETDASFEVISFVVCKSGMLDRGNGG